MNLFFRLLITFLKASFSKQRADALSPTRIRSRVLITDQDMFAHMTNSRYFSFSDLGIVNYIVRIGAWRIFRREGWFPVVCAEDVVIRRMLKSPHKFEVETRLAGWTDYYICMLHDFVRDGETTAQVRIIARFASRKREKVRVQQLIDALELDIKSPEIDEDFQRLIDRVERARDAI